jgi:predicted Zn finger-like uncharacterized protein
MSFITQCPACETQFKVAPDQLNVSEGWVRCGQCQHVFDASLNLQPWWPESAPPETPEPPEPHAQDTHAPPEDGQVLPDDAQAVLAVESMHHDALQEPHFDMPAEPVLSQGDEGNQRDPFFEAAPASVSQPDDNAAQEPLEPLAVSQQPPSFIKRAMEKAYWHQTSVRLTLYALIAVLLLVLGAQWFYRHKDDWAANHANLRPVLEGVCGVLRCQVNLPRKLSEVVIDSSSFVRRESNRFAFQLMLRNRAEVEVAMPTLELTLTNIENQVIARRLIPPADWPEQPTSLAPQAEWPLKLDLLLDVPPTQIVTGYQAELFYP